ncbi:MAG TPA: CsgG/HfaB family protein [Gemmatimonadaceae bacterium]|nr:CsgG/HfaB family protein [Gemmatimonadaceae bacterium]
MRITRAALLLLSSALLGASLGGQSTAALDARPTLAVMYFSNSSLVRHDEYEPLSKGMAEMLITELSANPGIRVVERAQLQKLLDEQNLAKDGRVDEQTVVKIGKLLGAKHMLFGGFIVDPRETMRLDIRSVDVETSVIEYTQSITGKASHVLDLISELGGKVNRGLKLPPIPASVHSAMPQKPPDGATKRDQLLSTVLLGRALTEQDKGNRPGAMELFQKAFDAYPDNPRPKAILVALKDQ